MTEETASADRCEICGEPDAPEYLQECFQCGRTFHLNPYNNQPGRDCGDALIGESLGVHYLCELCLQAMNDEAKAESAAMLARPTPAIPVPTAPPPAPKRTAPRRRYRRQQPS